MIIIYIDIILLTILLCLTIFTCGYCFYRVYTLRRDGQVAILLRPTKVLFSHKKEGEQEGELRTVVAYQNPFTGDYCVHKSRGGRAGYANRLPAAAAAASPDSGLSDEYEPLQLQAPPPPYPLGVPPPMCNGTNIQEENILIKPPKVPKRNDNTVSKTWNWNYTEYQI